MVSFDGPWSQDVDGLKKTVESMPDRYKPSLSGVSKDTFQKVCDPAVLHVWETDSDIDNLLQLTSVIAKLCNLGTRKDKSVNASDGSMVIIAEDKAGRNNFGRICQLVEHLTYANGKKHLEGTVAAFGFIVVVKGWNNSVRSDNAGKEVGNTVKRINIALERAIKMGSSKEKIVWHHGPVIHFLLYWINNTSPTLRSALHAITIAGSLDLGSSVKPSKAGSANTLPDLTCLETYAKKLDIPVVFLDPGPQLITSPHLATYMYYFGYYINTFLPASLSRPHLHKAQDELLTFAFQILGASLNKSAARIVSLVQTHLDGGVAKKFAQTCISASSFSQSACRAAGAEATVHRATHIADSPFSPFTASDISAFARLAVGPAAAPSSLDYTVALPTTLSYSRSRVRTAYPSHTFIVIPAPNQTAEQTTHRIQGTMMAVLERVRQEHGNPVVSDEEKRMWRQVRRGVEYALGKSRGRMPREVESRVKYVCEKVGRGTWGLVVGGEEEGKGSGKGEAARANDDAARVYGGGIGAHVGGVQRGVIAPRNSPGVGQEMPWMGLAQGVGAPAVQQYPQSYAAPPMGYIPPPPPPQQQQQQHIGAGYAQTHGVGRAYGAQPGSGRGAGGYPQSVGGSWL